MILRHLMGLVVTVLAFSGVHGDELPTPEQWFGSLSAAYLDPPSSHEIGETVEPALGIGYAFSGDFALELQWIPWQGSDGDAEAIWLTGLIDLLPADAAIDPYVAIGLGSTEFEVNGLTDRDQQAFVGLGFFSRWADGWSFRGDVRAVTSSENRHAFAQLGIVRTFGATPSMNHDDDRDGVRNRDDDCLDTSFGRVVDARGCEIPPVDSDADGVSDDDDRCEDTVAGVAVDSRGCERDGDRDGVVDRLDACPGSVPGVDVDARGCILAATKLEFSVEFDVDSARIQAASQAAVGRAMEFLERHREARAIVKGHTDSTGATSYNQGLSERRARALADRLLEGGHIRPDRIEVTGHGESQPIATNETEEGRQRNRRAEAVISER